ncbi:hypothetical protein HMPREF0043_00518 [Actinobaculum sp. oral taxon 183 str. F0552]|nr:hypothetical protein HMPREF0043_00518 [Actinobaculum sp. oral taxon 183 str. F0552]
MISLKRKKRKPVRMRSACGIRRMRWTVQPPVRSAVSGVS